jgi:predicted aspartyl protease
MRAAGWAPGDRSHGGNAVIGLVDAQDRALLVIGLRPTQNAEPTDVTVWVDTAFTGDLVLSHSKIVALGLLVGTAVPAVLADGSEIEADTFTGYLDWFGVSRSVEIIANDGQFPLLGMGMLHGRRLVIDYSAKRLTLD